MKGFGALPKLDCVGFVDADDCPNGLEVDAPLATFDWFMALLEFELREGTPNPFELPKTIAVGCWLPKGLGEAWLPKVVEDTAPKGVAAGCWLPKGRDPKGVDVVWAPKGVDVVGVPKGFLANGFAAGFGDGLPTRSCVSMSAFGGFFCRA